MTGKDIFSALGALDGDIVAAAAPDVKQKKTNAAAARWASVACLCIVLAICVTAALPKLLPPPVTSSPPTGGGIPAESSKPPEGGSATGNTGGNESQNDGDPPFDPPQSTELSAEWAAKVFYKNGFIVEAGGYLSAYSKLEVPEGQPVRYDPLSANKLLKIYKIERSFKDIDIKEFDGFCSDKVTKLLTLLDFDLSEAKIDLNQTSRTEEGKIYLVQNKYSNAKYALSFNQITDPSGRRGDSSRNFVEIHIVGENYISLGGKTVAIDLSLSETEVLSSLAEIRDLLFETFGCKMDESRLVCGAEGVYVEYYNRANEDFVSDSILIEFDPGEGGSFVRSIKYTQYRTDQSEIYTVAGEQTAISLKRAEELLKKGYVFGGHFCRKCMELQNPSCFDTYDFVSLTYVNNDLMALPFYVFYKHIGVNESGNAVYSKTYVCALELSGYEEYFEGQISGHKDVS